MQSYGRIPVLELTGGPHERGLLYGRQAAGLIGRAIDIYRDWFGWFAGLTWEQAMRGSERSLGYIRELCPDLAAELAGMAEGSGQPLAAIVALNARTEIAYGLGLARTLAARRGTVEPEGCTAVAVLPEHTGGAGLLIGQNWDWLGECLELRVALHIRPVCGPEILTFCEAGQLGKIGFNSAGISVCLNLLATTADGDRGLPVHVFCRLALQQDYLADTMRLLVTHPRAASSNLLVGRGLPDGSGEALDLEYSPAAWNALEPAEGLLVHTNHFLGAPGATDQAQIRPGAKCTYTRQARAQHLLQARLRGAGSMITAPDVLACLADHFDYPYSICNHQSGRPGEHSQTNLSFVAVPTRQEFWLSDGQPCGAGREGRPWQKYRMPWA